MPAKHGLHFYPLTAILLTNNYFMTNEKNDESVKKSTEEKKDSRQPSHLRNSFGGQAVVRYQKMILFFKRYPYALAGVIVIPIVLGAVLYWVLASDDTASLVQTTPVSTEVADLVEEQKLYRNIDGVEVADSEKTNEHLVGIMMENLAVPEVRPQKGLSKASVVYEAVAEGGITRFLAVFIPSKMPDEVFPVRSARPYYVDFNDENDAGYAHAGGSPEALAAISGLGTKDISGLGSSSRYFWRGPGYAPHNLYTSRTLMELAVRDAGWAEPTFETWTFADAPLRADRPTASTLTVDWASGTAYDAVYTYDPETNTYLRFHGTTPHLDGNTNEQIRATNILVQNVPQEELYPSGKGRLKIDITGEGKGYVVRNGEVISATWKKPDRKNRLRFYDAAGKEIALTRGNTWVEVVSGNRAVTLTEGAVQ